MSVTVGMPALNEASRYLAGVLDAARPWADRILVLDDGSSDDTREVAAAHGAEVRQTPAPLFAREWRLRSLLWGLVTEAAPDWVVMLDADEVLQGLTREAFETAPTDLDYLAAPLYDLWDSPETYRDDALWSAHTRQWPFAMRYRSSQSYRYRRADHHCGRWPTSIGIGQGAVVGGVSILHYGWMRAEDRAAKYERYLRLDPQGVWGSLEQYASIMDPCPNLSRLEASHAEP